MEVERSNYKPVKEIIKTQDRVRNQLMVQFELFSSLCKGRNNLWKQFLVPILSPEFIFKAVWDKDYLQLRTPMFNLTLSLYIDKDPLANVEYPQNLKVLHTEKDRSK